MPGQPRRAQRAWFFKAAPALRATISVGMGFFEAPEPLPAPHESRQPEWLGPADNMIGAAVPLALLLARNDQVALAITDARAYPNGVEFNLALRVRGLSGEARRALLHGGPFHMHRFPGEEPPQGIPPELLRLGVQFSDGRKPTTLADAHRRFEADPPGPVLSQRGGGGGNRAWDMRFWLWPLPPPGRLAFVAEWPLGGIPLTRTEIDAALILDASAHAQVLWPDGETISGGGWTTQYAIKMSNHSAPEKGSAQT
jgi:hypothetical protein